MKEAEQDCLTLERYENFHFSESYIHSYVPFHGSTFIRKVAFMENCGFMLLLFFILF